MGDKAELDLGLDQASSVDLLKLLARRLAQLEVQLVRIADAAELGLKLKLMQANVSLSALREAEEVSDAGAPPVDLLQQSDEELAAVNEAYERAEQRFGKGKVPVDLDLYAEVAKHAADNLEEEP
jgi:hypothetical protein